MSFHNLVKKELQEEVTPDKIIDVTLNLMKEIEKNRFIPGLDKKDLVLSTIKTVVSELDPNLMTFVQVTLPHLIDVFVSLNKREFVIKAIERGLPFCLKFCKK